MTDPTDPTPAGPAPADGAPADAAPAGATPAGPAPADGAPVPPDGAPASPDGAPASPDGAPASPDGAPADATPAGPAPADGVPAPPDGAPADATPSASADARPARPTPAETARPAPVPAASTGEPDPATTPDPSRPAAARMVGKPPGGARRALLPALVLLVVVVGALIAFGLGSPKSHTRLPGNVGETPAGGSFAGGTLVPAKAAPATTLRNYLGQTVSLSQYRGKVVFVTFLYTHCPDVCPLIATDLHATQAALGAANDKVQMIAISVDPKGDTPKAVANFLRVHNLVGRMQYLVGSAAELGRVWAAWNVGSAQDAASPALVDHSALVYGITAKGALTTIYPAQFKPSDLVHDTPLLLAR